MRAYLIFHLALLVGTNGMFRRFTSPTDDAWLASFLWLTFCAATSASLLILFGLLRRSTAFLNRLIAFACAWLCFYGVWSFGTIFASRTRYQRMARLNEDPFVLFAGTSGGLWSWDGSHFFFLTVTIPIFVIAAICGLGIHLWSQRRRTPGHGNVS